MNEWARTPSHIKNRHIPIYQVDAFASEPFTGNPAAVCVLDEPHSKPLDESTMQQIAAEMNLSETAFVHSLGGSSLLDADTFSLRWFTPKIEVPLCGHATLAASHVLFQELGVRSQTINFRTLNGELRATRGNNGITLNFPLAMPTPVHENSNVQNVMAVQEALGISEVVEIVYSASMKMLVILLGDEKDVRELKPDFGAVVQATNSKEIRGVIATAPGNPPYDFVSRFFGPWLGINEDSVTGAAHTVLAPYWSEKLNKKHMKAYQASERGGEMDVQILDAGGGGGGGGRGTERIRSGEGGRGEATGGGESIERGRITGRVELTGKAITVLKGTFHL